MSVEKGNFNIVHVKFNDKSEAVNVSEIALSAFGADGIEEFSINEQLVDEILGDRAYSGGDVPLEVIDEVEDETKLREELRYKYYFFNGDIGRSEDFAAHLTENFPEIEVNIEIGEYADWNEEWRKHYAPIVVTDDLSVVPEWFKEEGYKENKNNIYINPGMGFGTGEHETTFLCLSLFDEFKTFIPEKSLCLDFGCGSGILGIGAIKLRDMQVDFIDIDPAALDNCLTNLQLNFHEEDLNGHALVARNRFEISEKYNLVFANILEHVLISEKPIILDSLADDGVLILSGILNEQVDNIKDHYKSLELLSVKSKGDWSAIALRKK